MSSYPLSKAIYPLCIWILSFFSILHSELPSIYQHSQSQPWVQKDDKKRLCLTMIVKNESRIMERCLNTIKEIVDYISICDTGSSDNTVEIIENFLARTGIPGKVHRHEWKNFGHNRSLSITAAQEFLASNNFPMENTYLLFLDADMCFAVSPEFDKQSLTADNYLLEQKNSAQSYYNTRLVRSSLPWKCIGVTHEYYGCLVPASQAILNTLWIDDIGDGGCKSDKFERDIRLLTQGLKDEPNNERYMFYLAQSYHCLGKNEEAIKWYKARVAAGGWVEEVWYAKYQIAKSYEALNQWDEALKWYLDAIETDPARAEAFEKITTHYRSSRQNSLAYLFANMGRKLPYPKDHLLFVECPAYSYRFDEELSICSYYTPNKEQGFEATNRLVTNKETPEHIKQMGYRNMLFYVNNISNASFRPVEFTLPMVRADLGLTYKATNPSIIKTNDGYAVICKTVNYTQTGATNYTPIDPDVPKLWGNIKTRNFLLKYNKDFKLLSQYELIDDLSDKLKLPNRGGVFDIEDCRIFRADPVQFTCTVFDMTPDNPVEIGLCSAAKTPVNQSLRLESIIPLKGPQPGRVEKNWLPFLKDNVMNVIYSYDPFIIYAVDQQTGALREHVKYTPKCDLSSFRGSSGPVPFDNGYLVIVHEVVFNQDRFYLHRFLYLDKDFKIEKMSLPFTFKHVGIEFCGGMAMDHTGSHVLMGVGIEDAEAFIVSVDVETIKSMLRSL